MTISDLFHNYYFHDSSFLKWNTVWILKQVKKLYWCEFCDFLQENYQESEPANSDILILFRNHKFSGKFFKNSEVLEQKLIDDNTICFFLADEKHSDFSEFSVSADDVQIQVIRKYRL